MAPGPASSKPASLPCDRESRLGSVSHQPRLYLWTQACGAHLTGPCRRVPLQVSALGPAEEAGRYPWASRQSTVGWDAHGNWG